MVKTSESAIKIVILKQAEVAFTLEPKGTEGGKNDRNCILVTHASFGRKQRPNPALLLGAERGNPVSPLLGGQQTARAAYGGAGLGGRKKRMLCCNRADMGLNITQHESVPTSDWWCVARKLGEPLV